MDGYNIAPTSLASASDLGVGEAAGLGILQGLTEFLPVSSSGHLSLLQSFLGLSDVPKFFDVMLHVGTLAAVLVYYRRSLWQSVQDPTGAHHHSASTQDSYAMGAIRLAWLLILATLPTVVVAVAFRPTKLAPGETLESVDRNWRQRVGDLREHSAKHPWVVLECLTATSFVLLAGSRAKGGATDAGTMGAWHAIGIGLAQAMSATLPGLSRSGMTISTAMLLGLRGEWAVHFSLLMSIPAIAGALVLKTHDLDPAWLSPTNSIATAVGTALSAIVGWFCVRALVGAVRSGRWWWFSLYLWTLVGVSGLAILVRAS